MNKEAEKVRFSEKRFKEVLKFRKMTIVALGEDSVVDRSAKTIRRYMKEGSIPPSLLDRIARQLDVDPQFLSGEYDWPLDMMREDGRVSEEDISYFEEKHIRPQFFPYKDELPRKVDFPAFIEQALMLCSVEPERFNSLSYRERSDLSGRLTYTLFRVISKKFPEARCAEPDMPTSREKMNLNDIYEMLYFDKVDDGLIEEPEDYPG